MPQPTLAQDRVVDLVYTEVARGYGHDFAPVSNILFPIVPVNTSAGKIITFGPEDFIIVNTSRAPGQNTKRIQFGHAGAEFALNHHRLEAMAPLERISETAVQPGFDLVARSIRSVQRIMDREREYIGSVLARTANNYPVGNKSAPTGSDKWDDPASDPFSQVAAARSAVRKKCGIKPNYMILGDQVYSALARHPGVLDRLSNADIKVATKAQLELLFEMTIVVGEDVYYEESTSEFVDMWGNDAIIAVVMPKSMQEMGSPNFGYTYQLETLPTVEEGYFDKNPNSWIYPVADAYKPVLTGMSSGFLIQGAVTLA